MAFKRLPRTFRETETSRIMNALCSGESSLVVGVGSVGKSNLLRFLQREDIQEKYLQDQHADYLFVYVDSNKMLEHTLWGMMELMLHQMLIEIDKVDKEAAQLIDDLHHRVSQPDSRQLTLRYLDRAVSCVCSNVGKKLVFLFDEFDPLAQRLAPQAFGALRALRDDYKYRLMYIVTTRLELNRLREVSDIEAFEELVGLNTVWLGPYNAEDARVMLQRLMQRYQVEIDDSLQQQLLELSGGHPGILRVAFYEATRGIEQNLMHLSNRIADECKRIWMSLLPKERDALIHLINEVPLSPNSEEIVHRLQGKGLIKPIQSDGNKVFSPLFAAYIQERQPHAGLRLFLDTSDHSAWIDGRKEGPLSPLEFQLLDYLNDRPNQVCSRDELILHLYPDDTGLGGEGVTDTRLDAVVKRLRKRIEPDSSNPVFLVTVRGHGFQLFPAGRVD